MDSILTPIILGIVEGLTEFLPVSSTGHLIIASELLNLEHGSSDSFNIIIQLGAILAVVFLYKERFFSFFNLSKIKELTNIQKLKESKELNLVHIALSILPILAVGFLGRKFIKAHLFNTQVVVASLIFVGILLIIAEKFKPKAKIHSLDSISYKDAFIIGIAQCFALIPGVSRSGSTMITAMMRKIDLKTAADYSFLISVPVISAATIYEFIKSYDQFSSGDLLNLLIGFVVTFMVAIVGIKGFLIVLKKLSITPFAIYRILLGIFYYYYMTR